MSKPVFLINQYFTSSDPHHDISIICFDVICYVCGCVLVVTFVVVRLWLCVCGCVFVVVWLCVCGCVFVVVCL